MPSFSGCWRSAASARSCLIPIHAAWSWTWSACTKAGARFRSPWHRTTSAAGHWWNVRRRRWRNCLRRIPMVHRNALCDRRRLRTSRRGTHAQGDVRAGRAALGVHALGYRHRPRHQRRCELRLCAAGPLRASLRGVARGGPRPRRGVRSALPARPGAAAARRASARTASRRATSRCGTTFSFPSTRLCGAPRT